MLLQQGRIVLVFVEDDFESIIVANKLVKFGLAYCNNRDEFFQFYDFDVFDGFLFVDGD